MSFQNWKLWINSYDNDIKNFIIYILLTPLFNLGWNLKVPGVGLSVTAVFASIFILYASIYLLKSNKVGFPSIPLTKLLNFFCFLIIIDFFVTISLERKIYVIDQSLKALNLVLFYYIFKRIIRSEIDFFMLIQTYFYSYLIIILNFYVSFFGFSRLRSSRGFDRLTLGYYDVTNVAVQSIFILIFTYFFYLYFSEKKKIFKTNITLTLYFFFDWNINHSKHIPHYVLRMFSSDIFFVFNKFKSQNFQFLFNIFSYERSCSLFL